MRRDYLELISAYEQLPAPAELAALPGPEALRRQVALVASYRTLPFRDPDLPAALLPRGVARAARAFARQLRPGPQGGAADSAVWWNNFQAWLTDYDVDWCWRALNPTQPQGTIPVTNRHRSDWGDPEPWGLLAPDWRGVANPRVLDLLKSMMPPRTGPGII